jgi:hypothetical protein
VNRSQLEEVRRWGDALRRDEREEMRAAGEAIRRLCLEIDRLERELAAAQAVPDEAASLEAVVPEDGEPEVIEASLRDRLRSRLAPHRSKA